ncbi:hypothetical protein [Streptomyces sp. ISL-11]|uniref:hypothetical protein n=1 Tax=Streptomyces sp. ISL-11 TaxID=2819174 RepID=UPI001BEC9F9D|nr:hypothetical protein [Streptomyces sp. ISL-11]MBT2385884.1 hypothetical protein [Streptomyces sp. ISL-11]
MTDLDTAAAAVSDVDAGLRHFTAVMAWWTEPEMAAALAGGPAVIDPSEADEAAESCRLLRHLARDERSLVLGPLERARQHWIGTSPHELMPSRQPALARERFVAPHAEPIPPSTKPFHLGLYTSTAQRGGPSMWRMYLDQGSTLHPLPWHTWALQVTDPTAEVVEISSASAWAAFVGRYPLVHDGSVFPDWRKVAEDYAGVHMTLRAIVATQGLRFPVTDGLAAAPYWDVESVLWLRWHFSSPRLVEITPPHSQE